MNNIFLNNIFQMMKYTISFEFKRFLPHTIVLFGIIFIFLSASVNFFGLKFQERVFFDLSLTLVGWFMIILAISLGISNIASEIERKIIYTFITKPISREQYFLGKFLGIVFFLFLAFIIFSFEIFFIDYFYTKKMLFIIFSAIFLQFLKACIILSFTMILSLYVSSPINISLTLLFFVFSEMSILYASAFEGITKKIILFLKLALPYFDYFNINQAIVFSASGNAHPIYILSAIIYGISYLIFLLTLGTILFYKKEL
ncbi:MAG: hypothetical protein ACP5O4_02670 [bacterium]|jgi:ABC-type transport system involved in multi-copper enzyme maturation permease subunit